MPSSVRLWAATDLMSRPSNNTWPSATGRTPLMVFSVVVLPAPLAPMSVTISPAATVKEMPFSASTLP